MNNKFNKTILEFLEKNKEINSSNVERIEKEISEGKVYELRAYSEGKATGFSFSHTIKGWTKLNGVIIPNSKVDRTPKDEIMSNAWNNGNNNVIIALNKKIDDNHIAVNKKIDDNFNFLNNKIDNNHQMVMGKIDLLTVAIKELTSSLTKHINDEKANS